MGVEQSPCVLPGASVFPAAELTVYTHNSVPIWIPIGGGGGNEFRWSESDKRRQSVRQGGRRSSRLQIVATVSGCREFRPSLQPTFVSAVYLACSKWGLGNARVVVYGRNLSQIPLIFQASPHHPHPRRRTYFNIYGTVTAALGLGRREGGDIAEGKASTTERITICHLF